MYKNSGKKQFLDILTSTQTYRPQKLNIQASAYVESKVEIENNNFLRLDPNIDKKQINEQMKGIQILMIVAQILSFLLVGLERFLFFRWSSLYQEDVFFKQMFFF